jgi:hypothetical protein
MPQDDPIRRVNQRGRKERIESSGDPFPPDDAPDLPALDLSALPQLDDAQDLAELASLPMGLIARPLPITPEEERFPPIAPTLAEPSPPAPIRPPVAPAVRPMWAYHLITWLSLVASLAVCGVYTAIWLNPYSALNPAPPPTPYIIITATPASVVIVTPTLAPADSAPSKYPFRLIEAGIAYVPNGNGRACAWASIGGTVTRTDGTPLNGYRITIRTATTSDTVFSGGALTFGAGGYEYPIASAPQANAYSVQLFSPQGAPLSDEVRVETRATCEENVALVSFVGE